jgi:hypothetical protein
MSDDGSTTPALVYRGTQEGRTEIPLTFPARGSVFLIFSRPEERHLVGLTRDGNAVFPSIRRGAGVFSGGDGGFVATTAGTYLATDSVGSQHTFVVHATTAEPLGGWALDFPAGWGAPASVPVDHFESWTQSADPGIRYFSGTAVYRSTFSVPRAGLAAGQQLWLDLGEVREIVTVLVNDHKVETLWRPPFAVRIDPLLHAGNNAIEIQVTNLWPNRLIGDLQPSATKRFTQTNVRAYTQDSPLLPSGILQPVVLQTGAVLRWK